MSVSEIALFPPPGGLPYATLNQAVTSQITTANSDGTITITTTYADGSTATTTRPSFASKVVTSQITTANGDDTITITTTYRDGRTTTTTVPHPYPLALENGLYPDNIGTWHVLLWV
jgi:hypothetical protein